MVESDAAYTDLPQVGEYDVEIGAALISLVEPHPGTELAYNRWYEDDHFYSGALFMPWMFAGGRFVATRDLQLLRYPEPSAICQPLDAGCYLHLYWITRGRAEDHIRWSTSTNRRLRTDDRIHLDRTHVYTAFQDYLGGVRRSDEEAADVHALDHGYPAVVLEVVDAHEGTSREDLDAWLVEDYLPWVQRGRHSPVAQTTRFTPQPLPPDKMPDVADVPGIERRVTLVHFLTEDPRIHWMTRFARHGDRVAEGGLGSLQLCAPFVAASHGTNRYVDELREEPPH
jgi:hypothetical protein